MKMRRTLILALTIVLVLAAVGCNKNNQNTTTTTTTKSGTPTTTEAGDARRDKLVIALAGEPQTLDPYAHSNQKGFIVSQVIFDTLVKKADDGTFKPCLAKEWEFTDSTTLVMELRNDVVFHDGSKFTAEDVKFTLATAAQSSFSKSYFGCIDYENTKVIDEDTIEIKLLYAYAPLLEAMAGSWGAIISKSVYESSEADKLGREPIGTGPMKFADWVSGDRIELTANENYWGGPLAYDSFTARVITEASSRTIELETGGVDIIFDPSINDWDRLDNDPNLKLISGESTGITYLCFNNSIAPFNDIRVRQALSYALDLENLVKASYQGTGKVADSYYAPSLLGHKAVGPYEYNPEKAKQLLAEAGFPNGMQVKYITYDGNQAYLNGAEVIKNMWAQIGVEVDLQIVDLASFTSLNNGGEIPVTLLNNTARVSDPDAALLAWPTSRTISLRHMDTHIDDLLLAGKTAYENDERIRIYGELQDYIWSKLYTLPVAFPQGAYATAKYVTNLPFDPGLCPDLTRVQFTQGN